MIPKFLDFIKKSDVNGSLIGSNNDVLTVRGIIKVDDLNKDMNAGYYYIGDSIPANAPNGVDWSLFLNLPIWHGAFQFQIIIKPASGNFYIREQSGPQKTWSAWRKITIS